MVWRMAAFGSLLLFAPVEDELACFEGGEEIAGGFADALLFGGSEVGPGLVRRSKMASSASVRPSESALLFGVQLLGEFEKWSKYTGR